MRARATGLLLGFAADVIFKDPPARHPVAAFGQLAARTERMLYADRRFPGGVYVVGLVGGAAWAGRAVPRCNRWGVLTTAAATWATLGGASLAQQARTIALALQAGDLPTARDWLPHLCGRDPELLDAPSLARASVESVAENTSDAVVAPLLWGAVAGVPGMLAYRAVNTLDAMVGYRSARYRRFGSAAARLDDLANLVPARFAAALTVLCAPLVGGSALGAWQTWRRDAGAHPSPNAGQVEAAFAGALGVCLGGQTAYPHGIEQRPQLGQGYPPSTMTLERAVQLSRAVSTAAAFLCTALALHDVIA